MSNIFGRLFESSTNGRKSPKSKHEIEIARNKETQRLYDVLSCEKHLSVPSPDPIFARKRMKRDLVIELSEKQPRSPRRHGMRHGESHPTARVFPPNITLKLDGEQKQFMTNVSPLNTKHVSTPTFTKNPDALRKFAKTCSLARPNKKQSLRAKTLRNKTVNVI